MIINQPIINALCFSYCFVINFNSWRTSNLQHCRFTRTLSPPSKPFNIHQIWLTIEPYFQLGHLSFYFPVLLSRPSTRFTPIYLDLRSLDGLVNAQFKTRRDTISRKKQSLLESRKPHIKLSIFSQTSTKTHITTLYSTVN